MDEAERCTKLAYIAYGHMLTTGTAQEIIKQANLHTWEISGTAGKSLAGIDLEDTIKNLPGVTQVCAFGQVLHVSGIDSSTVKHSLDQHLPDACQYHEIKPTLEDVFITLVKKGQENAK